MVNKTAALRSLDFGSVDGETDPELVMGFIQTEDFREFMKPDMLVALGPKGSGKSAIFRMLTRHQETVRLWFPYQFGNPQSFPPQPPRVLIEAATGTGDHKDVSDYDLGEVAKGANFSNQSFWRIYIALKSAAALGKAKIKTQGELRRLSQALGESPDWRIVPILRGLWNTFVGDSPPAIRIDVGGVAIDFANGKRIDVNEALVEVHEALEREGKELWLLFDKIDELRADNQGARKALLQDLFQTQIAFLGRFPRLKLKIFLRTDIWRDLEFVNKSHLDDKMVRLEWQSENLLRLINKRALSKTPVRQYVAEQLLKLPSDLDKLTDEQQRRVFYAVFDVGIYSGEREADLFDWILKRIKDSRDDHFPRELIVWGNESANAQRKVGPPKDPFLIAGASALEGFRQVSDYRVRTYLAEFPRLREHVKRFQGQTTADFSRASLSALFSGLDPDATATIEQLSDIGVLRPNDGLHASVASSYTVVPLYRIGLGLNLPGRP